MKLCTPWDATSRSYDVICQVMLGRNRRILRSIVSDWVSSLSGLFFHRSQYNWCLWISRSHMQLPRGQGQARARVPWAVSVVHFTRYNSNFIAILNPWSLLRANVMSYLESTPTHRQFMICHVSRSSEVIRGHLRSYKVTDLRWPRLIDFSLEIYFGAFWSVLT